MPLGTLESNNQSRAPKTYTLVFLSITLPNTDVLKKFSGRFGSKFCNKVVTGDPTKPKTRLCTAL